MKSPWEAGVALSNHADILPASRQGISVRVSSVGGKAPREDIRSPLIAAADSPESNVRRNVTARFCAVGAINKG
jgi:hypothetical protein